MWVDKKRTWMEMVAFGGVALPRIWVRTLIVTGIAVVVTGGFELVPVLHYPLSVAPFTLVGLPLGIFLGFRNNTAYDRFWEGRKLWGALVNTARSLTRQVLTLIDGDDGAKLVHLVIAYVHAFKHHLRDTDAFAPLAEILPASEVERLRGEVNVPIAILQRLGELFREARKAGRINPMHATVLEASLVSLTDIQGGCERIKATPMPYSYTVLMHRIVAGYCALLPFGLMEAVKWATPLVVLAISYCFFGLDAIGDEIEQPFGTDTNDLPLDAISVNIERNLRQRIGEPLPPAPQPTRSVLS